MAVLALVIAALLGLLLVNRFQIWRQRTAYNDLSQQYSALSGAYDGLKEHCDALEQEARDAQGRAESAERELEAIRQSVIIMETTPEPTEQPGTSVVVQEGPNNE